MGAVISLIFTAIFLGLSEPCIKIFITDGNTDAIGTGVNFLKIVTPFYVIIAVKIIADGTLRGTNRMLSFTIATFIDLLLRVVFSAILKNRWALPASGGRGRSAGLLQLPYLSGFTYSPRKRISD